MKNFHQIIICGMVYLNFGCSPSTERYKITVRDGIRSIPHVNEIENMFPNTPTDHFITEFEFNKTDPVMWNTEVFFGGKYVLTYQVYVSVDYARNRIVRTTSDPQFILVQASGVFDASPETVGAKFDADHKFGESDWEKIVKAHRDFSVIGINIDTNHPVPRFDEFVRDVRKPRLQVQ